MYMKFFPTPDNLKVMASDNKMILTMMITMNQ